MIYVFGDCELDLRFYELRRDGVPRPLARKPFDLLLYLLRARDRLVLKAELLDTVWSGSIITEATLSHCVMTVRRAIGDCGKEQHLIRTHHGRGYRFVGKVCRRDAPARAPTPVPAGQPRGADRISYPEGPGY